MLPKPGRNDPASHLAWKKGFLLKSHLSLWFTFQTNAAKNTTQKILGTFDKLAEALTVSMVPGEVAQELTAGSISLGVSRTKTEDIGKKPLKIGGSEVTIPQNLTVFGNKTLDIMVCYFV